MTPLEAAARAACGIGERYDWAGRNVGYEWADGAARDYWINSTRVAIGAFLKACAEDEAIEAPAKAMWEMHADEPLQVGKWKEPTDYREFKHLSDSARAKIIGLARACISALEPKA